MGKTKADLEREVSELKAKLGASSGVPPKEREATETRASNARRAVEGISVESVVSDITSVSLATGRAFSNLTETLVAKTKQLEEIDLAIQVKTADLETLLGKEAVGSALAAQLEDYDRQKRELNEAITAARQAWEAEKTQYQKLIQERNAETQKARTREEDQFTYDREQRRRSEDAAWKNELADRQRAEQLRAADFERKFAEREAALKAREAEYTAALARVAGIQAEIDAAVKKEVAIVTNAITRENRHATEIAQRDHATQLATVQAKLDSAEIENRRLVVQAKDLQDKLGEAYAKNVSLSEKALDAASGRQALTELRDLQTVRAENNGSTRGKS